MAYLNNLPRIGPPFLVGKTPAGPCRTLQRTLSPQTTAAVIKRSKELGITVTSAVHAAYILMLQNLNRNHLSLTATTNTTRYTGITAHNMRRHIPALANPKYATVGLYYACQFTTIPLPASYLDLCQALNRHYKSTIDAETLSVHDAFTQTLAAIVRSPEYQSAPIPTDATTSSLGVVERYTDHSYQNTDPDGQVRGKVEVVDDKICCNIVLGMITVHFWTFREVLRLVYGFNEAYEEPRNVEGCLEEMERVLVGELVGGV